MTEATSVGAEDARMAITLGKRKRSQRDPARSLDEVTQAERAAMSALADTLRHLASELPEDSLLACEFGSVARSIDAAGVLGTWRLDRLAREIGEDAA
jgi:hypothetical protein